MKTVLALVSSPRTNVLSRAREGGEGDGDEDGDEDGGDDGKEDL
jgi:hypothetical protein